MSSHNRPDQQPDQTGVSDQGRQGAIRVSALSSTQIHAASGVDEPSNNVTSANNSHMEQSTPPPSQIAEDLLGGTRRSLSEPAMYTGLQSMLTGLTEQSVSGRAPRRFAEGSFTGTGTHFEKVIGKAVGVSKIGPLQDISDMLRGFAEMHIIEGEVKDEHQAIQQRLETLLETVDSRCGGVTSPVMISKIEGIREWVSIYRTKIPEPEIQGCPGCISFIKRELHTLTDNQTREQPGKLHLTKENEDRFMVCYYLVQERMEQLLIDPGILSYEIREQQAKDRASSLIGLIPSSPSAWYNSATGAELERRGCTLGTRLKVLASLLGWATDRNLSGVCWLNGMAGTGKTTIAYSMCKKLVATGNFGASFFCSRQREECRNVNAIIPSIAYQLAQHSPAFQFALSDILEEDKDAHHKTLEEQFEALIKKPLLIVLPNKSPIPEQLVVVIDALDECENEKSTRMILKLLLSKTANLPIKFIISSRPEPQIRDYMSEEAVKSRLVLHELDRGEVQEDVEKYLWEELAPMSPSAEQISALVKKAGILFIYAATAVRYIGYDNFQSDPESRLNDILNGPQSPEDTGNDGEIDQLYTTILEAALGNRSLRAAQRNDMRHVIYTVICAREPLTVKVLSGLLGIKNVERIRTALRPLGSVLHVMEGSELVTTLHASFSDFMFDPARSDSYFCDSDTHHRKLAEHCFDYIAQTRPSFNICRLDSSYISDINVPNIRKRVAECISSELMYACRYWADHVKAANCASGVGEHVQDFLSTRLLLWMEVLNLTNQMKAGIECVKLVAEWYGPCMVDQEVDQKFEAPLARFRVGRESYIHGRNEDAVRGTVTPLNLAEDAKRFVEAFASNPVSQSTPHIYLSMLAFWPRSAPIAEHYVKRIQGPVKAEGTALDRRQLAHLSTWAFEDRVVAMAVSPGGLHVGLGIGNNVVVVDSSSGKTVLGPLKGHPEQVRSVAFAPDGSWIIAGSFGEHTDNATIIRWDTHTGDAVLGPLWLHGHKEKIYCLSFSPDRSCIATGSRDGTVRLWDAKAGQILHRLEAQDRVHAAAFSPDGVQVAAGVGKTLRRWDTRTGKSFPTNTPLIITDDIYAMAYSGSPDWPCIALAGGASSAIYIWSPVGGGNARSIQGHTSNITCIGFSPNGRFIVSGSYDRTVRVWNAQTGYMVLGPLEGHTDTISLVSFSPDGSRIISVCEGGLVCTWDARQRTLGNSSHPSTDPITCVKFSSDGTCFVTGSADGAICICDAHTGEMLLGPVKVHSSRINAVDFKNGHVALGALSGKLCVCGTRSGEVELGPLQAHSWEIQAIAYSPDGKLIATGSYTGVCVWNAQSGSRVLGPLAARYGNVLSVQFSPNSTRVVASSGTSGSNIVVWDVSDGRNVFGTLDGHDDWVRSVSYSPNSALIVSGSDDRTIILWDAHTGKKALGPLVGHSDSVRSVSFSPDSARLVSGSDDRTIRIWDVQTGEMIFELLRGHETGIKSVEYSLDGTCILSCSDDMSVRTYDARSPEEKARLRPESEVRDWTINKDGWVVDDQSRLLVWVPGDLRKALMWPSTLQIRVPSKDYVKLKFDTSRMGEAWGRSYDSNI